MSAALRFILVAAYFLGAAAVHADSASAEVIFRGTFRGPSERLPAGEAPPKVSLGSGWIGPRPREETAKVTGTRGLQFGLLFIARNTQPTGTPLTLRYVTRFPAPGMLQPGGKAASLSAESMIECLVGLPCSALYAFDSDWEILSGTWRFEIYDGAAKLVDESIEIQASATSP